VPLLYFARCAGSGETHGNQGAEERGSRDPSRQPAPQPVGCGRQEVIRSAKNRGYVAHDQINSVLPSEEVNSEQIEGVLADETE
jgi:RNA polymerase primary sigma factor